NIIENDRPRSSGRSFSRYSVARSNSHTTIGHGPSSMVDGLVLSMVDGPSSMVELLIRRE
ncbi:MAG: hypothetical protein WBM17_05630, partial [Anaerolineales bacterium]